MTCQRDVRPVLGGLHQGGGAIAESPILIPPSRWTANPATSKRAREYSSELENSQGQFRQYALQPHDVSYPRKRKVP